MPIIDNEQYSFNAGEISPRVQGRVDLDKFNAALDTCLNAIILPSGAVTRRPGLIYLGETKDSSKLSRLVPFRYSETQAYVLEIGDNYTRFWMDGGIIVSPDSYTTLLLHMDGVNASVEFKDDGVNNHVISANGTAKITTDDYMFGTGSLILGGDGDYLSSANSTDWYFGSGRVTIDFWFYVDVEDRTHTVFFQGDSGSTNDGNGIFIDTQTNDIVLIAVDSDAFVGGGRWNYSSGFSVNTWYHVAIIRGWGDVTDDWMACVNGVACDSSGSTISMSVPNHDGELEIGTSSDLFIPDMSGKHVIKPNADATISTSEYKFGNASLYMDGTGDYFETPDSADWDILDSTDFTISLFMKHVGYSGTKGIISQTEDQDNKWSLLNTESDAMKFKVRSGGSDLFIVYGAAIEDTNWHHVAVIKTGTKYAIYVDGLLTGYCVDADTDTFSGVLRLGSITGDTGSNYKFYGYLDDVIIDKSNIFNADLDDWLKDESDNDVTVIPREYHTKYGLGGPLPDTSTYKFGNASFSFEATNANMYASGGSLWDITTNFTIDLWVKHATYNTNQGYLMQYQDTGNNWRFWMDGVSGTRFNIRSGGSSILNLYGGVITDTSWHHVALCKKGNEYGIYLDGTQTAYLNSSAMATFPSSLYIGLNIDGVGTNHHMDGHMDGIRIIDSNPFGASPNSGLTDTITVPTSEHTSDSDTQLLLNCPYVGITVPTAKVDATDNTVLAVRGDHSDMSGGIDEYRISKGIARWTADFNYPTSAYPGFQGGTTYELTTTPWTEADVGFMRWAQSEDTLYVCNPNFNVYKFTRTDHDSWTCEEIDWNEPPWQSVTSSNPDGFTLTPSATTGSITITSSGTLFGELWVGAYIAMNSGFVRITAVTDATHATATVKSDLSGTSATVQWQLSAWNNITGWPRCIAFHQDRLVLAGAGGEPLTFRMSGSGEENHENFKVGTGDADPLAFTILAERQNAILWLSSGKYLYIGTASAEYKVTGSDTSSKITPSSVDVGLQSHTGSIDHQPVSVGSALVYIQRAGKVVNAWEYQYLSDVYEPTDISVLSEHLSATYQYEELAYAQDPLRVVWIRREDGTLVGVTILKDQKVIGWHRHSTETDSGPSSIESMAVIPGDSQGKQQDETWCIVNRTIDGSTKRYIEMIDVTYDQDSIVYHRYMDSALTYSGTPATTFSGVDHLEGEDVIVIADGVSVDGITISGGGFTLSDAASEVTVGKAYNTDIGLLDPSLINVKQGQSTSFHEKRYVRLLIGIYETCQLLYGPDSSSLLDAWSTLGLSDGVLYNGKLDLEFNGDYTLAPTCLIRQNKPYGFTLISLTEKVDVEMEG